MNKTKRFDHDLTEKELREILEKYRNEGRYDNDWLKEALWAQMIIELRETRIEHCNAE